MATRKIEHRFIAGWIDLGGDAQAGADRLPRGEARLVLPHIAAFGAPVAPREDGTLVAALDGGFHNRAELAGELDAPAGVDDLALLVLGHRRWGSDLPAHLRGEFAAVLWDASTRSGLTFCDQMAHRTLWTHRSGQRLVFASDARYLLPLLARTPEPDLQTLAEWLTYANSAGERTMFAGVSKLRAGHRCGIGMGPALPVRYWRAGDGPMLDVDAHQAASLVRDSLATAVERRMPGSGTVAVMLSGGMDSSTVAGFAARHDPSRVSGYSAVFPTFPTADESRLVRELRTAYGIRGTEIAVRSGSVLAGAVGFVERWRMPPVSPNLFFWNPLLDAAHADGATVLLDGEGGDELFGNEPYLLSDLLLRGRVRAAADIVRRGLPETALDRRTLLRILAEFGVRGAIPHGLHERLRRRTPLPSWLQPRAAAALERADDPWGWKRDRGPRWRAHLRAVLSDLGGAETYEHVRRRAADSGLLARHPIVDLDVIDLVMRLPPQLAYDERYTRPLLREAVRGMTPDAVRLRRGKSNFDGPFHAGLSGPDREPLQRLLGSDSLVREHIRSEHLTALTHGPWPESPGAARMRAIQLFRAATAELWLRDLAGQHLSELAPVRQSAAADYSFFRS